jgi:hypothetical protein
VTPSRSRTPPSPQRARAARTDAVTYMPDDTPAGGAVPVLLIDTAEDLPAGTPAGIVVVVQNP